MNSISSCNRHCYLPFQQPFQPLCRYSPFKFLERKTPAFFPCRQQNTLVQASCGPIFILKIVSFWRINDLVTLAMVLLKDAFFFLKKMFKKKVFFFSGQQCAIYIAQSYCNHLAINLLRVMSGKIEGIWNNKNIIEPLNKSTLKSSSVQSSCYGR